MQDNDPKHTFCAAKKFFEVNCVNWWKTKPPELEFIRRETKPSNKQEALLNSRVLLIKKNAQNISATYIK